MDDAVLSSIEAAMVSVGSARGFVVEALRRLPPIGYRERPLFVTQRLVITAAHCLPFLPSAFALLEPEEHTYRALLGPLDAEPTAAAECLFVDPIADLAVLGEPDREAGYDQRAYTALVEGCAAVPVGTITSTAPCPAWLLIRAGRWECCSVYVNELDRASALIVVGATEGNRPGTSGSPIITSGGCAVGIVSVGAERDLHPPGGPVPANPRLASCLPAWLLTQLHERTET
jgi:hypothetical protein